MSEKSTLRVAVVAAPNWASGRLGSTLKSPDPFSLFNACRYAAHLAETRAGPWADSNWSVGRRARRDTFVLMNSLESDFSVFENMLRVVKPNLLLVGAMTLCLPGAAACAKFAKDMFGDQICIVLGGWHPSESIYLDGIGKVKHHASSPLRLMSEGRLPEVFDIVVAGEGEYAIAAFGEAVAALAANGIPAGTLKQKLGDFADIPGRWIIGSTSDGVVQTLVGRRLRKKDYDFSPPCELFGASAQFEVFDGRLTAHVSSDSGRGCVYDCMFCSERRSSAGFTPGSGAANRLFRHFSAAARVIQQSSGRGASAFVEDSTLLGGSKSEIRNLIDLLGEANLDLRFGAQLTIDQILTRADLLRPLKAVGLDYLFIGIETPTPHSIGGMSKDVGSRHGSWLHRTERCLELLAAEGIRCGAATLFGLGEERIARLGFFRQLDEWRKRYGSPDPISLNWAVQHPLKGDDGGTNYRYDEWGTPAGEWTTAFSDFGEGSLLYPLSGKSPPTLSEVTELASLSRSLAAVD